METVKLNSGYEMPLLGYGVYQIPGSETKQRVLEALETGYRLFDTAQYYGNEAGVGDAVAEYGISREEIFLTTKIMSNRNVGHLIDDSLRKLRTDYIDLLLIHWVMGNDLATWRTMEDYVRQGKVCSIGLSNFYGKDYENIIKHCKIKPAVMQQETHVYYQNKHLQKLYQRDGIYLEAWAPFGEGRKNMLHDPVLETIAKAHGRSVAQVILRFLVQRGIIVIPKTVHKERMKENMQIFDFSLTDADIEKMESLDKNKSLFGWYS